MRSKCIVSRLCQAKLCFWFRISINSFLDMVRCSVCSCYACVSAVSIFATSVFWACLRFLGSDKIANGEAIEFVAHFFPIHAVRSHRTMCKTLCIKHRNCCSRTQANGQRTSSYVVPRHAIEYTKAKPDVPYDVRTNNEMKRPNAARSAAPNVGEHS